MLLSYNKQFTYIVLLKVPPRPLWAKLCYAHFADEKAKAQKKLLLTDLLTSYWLTDLLINSRVGIQMQVFWHTISISAQDNATEIRDTFLFTHREPFCLSHDLTDRTKLAA